MSSLYILYHRGHISGAREALVISEGKVWWNSVKAALFVVTNQCSKEARSKWQLSHTYIHMQLAEYSTRQHQTIQIAIDWFTILW